MYSGFEQAWITGDYTKVFILQTMKYINSFSTKFYIYVTFLQLYYDVIKFDIFVKVKVKVRNFLLTIYTRKKSFRSL